MVDGLQKDGDVYILRLTCHILCIWSLIRTKPWLLSALPCDVPPLDLIGEAIEWLPATDCTTVGVYNGSAFAPFPNAVPVACLEGICEYTDIDNEGVDTNQPQVWEHH